MAVEIVGWGHTKFGRLDALSLEDLIGMAAREALADAGVAADEVEAIWLSHYNGGLVDDAFCSSMVLAADPGLRFKPAMRCENACASGATAIFAAVDAINSGRVKIALVVGAEKMTGLDTAGVTAALARASYQKEEAGLSFPQIFAEFAKAYAAAFGDPSDAMARIAVKNHANALRNPLAQMHRSLDLDFCRTVSDRNPMIADPLKMSDCSLVSDGAAAIVLVHSDLAARFRRAVRIRAIAHVNDYLSLAIKDLTRFEGPRRAIEQALAAAGVGIGDIGLAEVHDCFTIAELLVMEAMGLARPGEAAAALREGVTERGGRLPINLSGGLKAKGHPIGATGVSMHVMVARQLAGEAGDMQIGGSPELGMCFNMGGGAVANCCSILEAPRT
jgi:acetyl-CoA C-acetyltransferase